MLRGWGGGICNLQFAICNWEESLGLFGQKIVAMARENRVFEVLEGFLGVGGGFDW